MYTLYKFHFLNGISEINQLFYMTSTCIFSTHEHSSSHLAFCDNEQNIYFLYLLFVDTVDINYAALHFTKN